MTAPAHPDDTAQPDTSVRRLGDARFRSPLESHASHLVTPDERVLLSADLADVRACAAAGVDPPSFELAGPRDGLYLDPARVTAGIVTCGGLCPGLNNVIRSIVLTPSGASIGTGGGITALSDPDDEVEETRVKARALIAVLGGEVPAPSRAPDANGPRPPHAIE